MADTNKKQSINHDSSNKFIKIESAVSILNDFHHFRLMESGDIGFRVAKSFGTHVKGEATVTRYIHSIILFARSKWFRKAYNQFLKNKKDENRFELNAYTQSIFKDGDNKLCFNMSGIDILVFLEFGIIKMINRF